MVKAISLLFWQALWAAEIEKGELEIPSRNLWSSYTYYEEDLDPRVKSSSNLDTPIMPHEK